MKKSSRIKDFYKKNYDERLAVLKDFASLTDSSIDALKRGMQQNAFVDKMSENIVSSFSLPYSIATNFLINGSDYLIPMVTEEPSVVAAASNAAKLSRCLGGFFAEADQSLMIGQIHLNKIVNPDNAIQAILKHKLDLIDLANKKDSTLIDLGGGAIDLVVNNNSNPKDGNVLTVHLVVDVRDAMGANAVNSMVEFIAPELEKITGAKALMSIISNYSLNRIARAKAVWCSNEIGCEVVQKIVQATTIAKNDIFRAVTHNKGIMNGVDAVAVATGNDFRALEASIHAYASAFGRYMPLSDYTVDDAGDLVGSITLPMAVGIVGGSTKTNPMAKLSLEILGVKTASALAQIMACVGLAQNFAALKALVDGGIQQGHMRLHSKNIAINAGIPDEFVDCVAEKMVKDQKISVADAKDIFNSIKNGGTWK